MYYKSVCKAFRTDISCMGGVNYAFTIIIIGNFLACPAPPLQYLILRAVQQMSAETVLNLLDRSCYPISTFWVSLIFVLFILKQVSRINLHAC